MKLIESQLSNLLGFHIFCSDSRCAALDFAFGLYEPPCRDTGCAVGPPVFRAAPCTRAAPRTPPEPAVRFGARTPDVAFAVT
jgi:hypothetical protein